MSYREPMTLDERHAIRALHALIGRVPRQKDKGFIRSMERQSHIGIVSMSFEARIWIFSLIVRQRNRIADEHYELATDFFDRVHGRGAYGTKQREAVTT